MTITLSQSDVSRLGLMADPTDRYDLMLSIKRCDELVAEIRAIQLVHSENLCRVANRFAAEAAVGEPFCNHDAVAVVDGVCECGEVIA